MFVNPFKKIDSARRKRSSNVLRQSIEQAKVIDTRLKICVFVVCAFFIAICVRLVSLQIINQQEYVDKLANYTAKKQSFSSPRGTIFDNKGNVLVQSVSSLTISYYPLDSISDEEEWTLAENLVNELHLSATNISDRQLKDMFMVYEAQINKNKLDTLLSKKEWKQLEDSNYDAQNLEDKILEKKLANIDVNQFDEHTRALYQVKMRMDASPNNQYKVIAEDVSEEQFSYIAENSSHFPGFKGTFDWKREYGESNDFSSILGKISTQTQGVPSEEKDFYLALDYSLNDRVGISGLEKQYENYLSGSKSIYNIDFDEQGNAILKEEEAGKSGYDLTLTIDTEYQRKMDEVLKGIVEKAKSNSFRSYFSDLYFIAMNPKTGAIYSMNGASKGSDGTVYSNPSGTYLEADRAGSAVKLATLYMGLNEGVVKEGEVIMDAPINIKGTAPMASYHNYGPINGVQAIAKSSNVYMWNIAIRLGGSRYVSGAPLNMKSDTFSLMRSYYNMFGLGVKTGIDLPDEQVGTVGSDNEIGKALHFAIGQYDTYTTMQLAQYAATIANGGKRVQPYLVSKISEVNDPDTIVFKNKTNVLSTLLGNVKLLTDGIEGMKICVSTAFCGSQLSAGNTGVEMAAKSGTAENEIYSNGEMVKTTNSTLIAFGPTEDPEVVFACSAPSSNNGFGASLQDNVCSDVIGQAAKDFFKK